MPKCPSTLETLPAVSAISEPAFSFQTSKLVSRALKPPTAKTSAPRFVSPKIATVTITGYMRPSDLADWRKRRREGCHGLVGRPEHALRLPGGTVNATAPA